MLCERMWERKTVEQRAGCSVLACVWVIICYLKKLLSIQSIWLASECMQRRAKQETFLFVKILARAPGGPRAVSGAQRAPCIEQIECNVDDDERESKRTKRGQGQHAQTPASEQAAKHVPSNLYDLAEA
jgi:hypothetical protein